MKHDLDDSNHDATHIVSVEDIQATLILYAQWPGLATVLQDRPNHKLVDTAFRAERNFASRLKVAVKEVPRYLNDKTSSKGMSPRLIVPRLDEFTCADGTLAFAVLIRKPTVLTKRRRQFFARLRNLGV